MRRALLAVALAALALPSLPVPATADHTDCDFLGTTHAFSGSVRGTSNSFGAIEGRWSHVTAAPGEVFSVRNVGGRDRDTRYYLGVFARDHVAEKCALLCLSPPALDGSSCTVENPVGDYVVLVEQQCWDWPQCTAEYELSEHHLPLGPCADCSTAFDLLDAPLNAAATALLCQDCELPVAGAAPPPSPARFPGD